MPPRRKPRPTAGRPALPPEVPEAAKPTAPPAAASDDDLLPDDLRKMLEAAYT